MRASHHSAIGPLSTRVYIEGAACTRITARPDRGFYELCLEAARRALLGIDPMEVDSFYVASMQPEACGVTGELTAALAAELGLMPSECLGLRGTSSAGGIGCIPSFKDIASGLHRRTLLVSCEQMNPLAGEARDALEERRRTQTLLAGVVDAEDRRYGLAMVNIGDLMESALDHYLGLDREAACELIGRITMEMYRRAALYPYAQFAGNQKSQGDYEGSPWITPFYRRDDVVPISSGACAIVFSATPPAGQRRVVRLRGIGQGIQHPSLARRFGPITISPSVRRAVFGMLQRAGLTLPQLRQADLGFPHDAFPSISRIILKEIGFDHDASLEGLLGGRFNPCGGLLKCGHPVGCSGELQLVRAFQVMTHDESVPEIIRPAATGSAFTVSVGAALTNIIALYLETEEAGAAPEPATLPPPAYYEGLRAAYLDDPLYARFEAAMNALPAGAGVILAHTRTGLGWVSLLQLGDRKCLALREEKPPIGALVEVGQRGGLNVVERIVEDSLEVDALQSFGIIPGAAGEPQRAAAACEGALVDS